MIIERRSDFEKVQNLLLSNDPSCQTLELKLNVQYWGEHNNNNTRNLLDILGLIAGEERINSNNSNSNSNSNNTNIEKLIVVDGVLDGDSEYGITSASIRNELSSLIGQIIHRNFISLKSLELRYWIGDEGCIPIANGLCSNSNLLSLTMRDCCIGDEGTAILSDAIAQCRERTALENLDLFNNEIFDEGCVHIARALAINSSIKRLRLSFCRIGNDGAKALAKVLKEEINSPAKNTSLEELNLFSNNIAEEGCIALSNALSHNTHLKKIDIYFNGRIGFNGWRALELVLETNFVLRDMGDDVFLSTEMKRNLDLNKNRPVEAEATKTGLFPRRLWFSLDDDNNGHGHDHEKSMDNSCYLEALAKVISFQKLSVVYSMVRERPLFFSIDRRKRRRRRNVNHHWLREKQGLLCCCP